MNYNKTKTWQCVCMPACVRVYTCMVTKIPYYHFNDEL